MLKAEQLENVKREMKRNNLKMLGLTGVRWNETGDVSSDKYRVILSRGQQSRRGVELVLVPTVGQSVSEVERTSDRIMRMRMRGTRMDIVVIVVNMPTADYEDEDVVEVYEQEEDEIRKGRGDGLITVMGDLSAVVGEQGEKDVAGKHGLGHKNDRGQILLEFCK